MDTSRDDVGIAIRSALLDKGTKQKFSLFVLVILSIILIFIETIEVRPLNYLRSFIKDTIYRGSLIVSVPSKSFSGISDFISNHINVYNNHLCEDYHYDCIDVWGEQECIDCPDNIEGDVNGDGEVNVLDIVLISYCILGDYCDEYECSDLNYDGSVDILDIIIMVNLTLYP